MRQPPFTTRHSPEISALLRHVQKEERLCSFLSSMTIRHLGSGQPNLALQNVHLSSLFSSLFGFLELHRTRTISASMDGFFLTYYRTCVSLLSTVFIIIQIYEIHPHRRIRAAFGIFNLLRSLQRIFELETDALT